MAMRVYGDLIIREVDEEGEEGDANKEVDEDKDVEEKDVEKGEDMEGDKEERDDDEHESQEDNEERADEEGRTVGEESEASSDEEGASRALMPDGMYFPPAEYTKASVNNVKIGTRCSVRRTLEFLKPFQAELKWFTAHEQFKHVFHMPEEPNHQLQGMLMLVLRTARTSLDQEAWFVVNGMPIRYSIREHAILTGFNCNEYPPNWTELGSLAFVEKVFGKKDLKKEGVKVSDVEAKLQKMKNASSTERKKLAVLYFLCNVVKAKSKNDGKIDTFLLRIVDDLSACKTFPWGRYTFEDCIDGLKKMLKNMDGVTKKGGQPSFSGFIIPLEILPFECIPVLGRKFRADVSADPGCPRMCKRKFAVGGTKGFSLDEINETLGDTKDIISILEPTDQERGLLRRNVNDYVDERLGYVDPVVDTWTDRLLLRRKKVFWKTLYEQDVRARGSSSERPSSSGRPSSSTFTIEEGNVKEKTVETLESLKAEILGAVDKGIGSCLEAIGVLDEKVVKMLGDLESRVKVIQNYVAKAHTTVADPPSNIIDEEAKAEEVARELMELGKAKEKEKLEKGKEKKKRKRE